MIHVCYKLLVLYTVGFVSLLPQTIHPVTHWYVDENGNIKQQAESIYNLKNPNDLITFMKQEKTMRQLEDLQSELMSKKEILQPTEIEKVDVEHQLFLNDEDCIQGQIRLSNYDLYLSSSLRLENKGINLGEHIHLGSDFELTLKEPVCKDDLPFSMYSYDHLKGVAEKHKLANFSESGMMNVIPSVKNIVELGDRVHEALKKNSTSWVLLNLAALYWRIKGDAIEAVNCLRKALHHSPRKHKDIALVSLANILHRSKYSLDAAILMHNALETTTEFDIAYFTLGNIYASLGQYDLAELCYKYVEDLHPGFEAAKSRRHAARCETKLDNSLEQQHKILKRTLEDLEDFRHKQKLLEDQQRELLSHKQHNEQLGRRLSAKKDKKEPGVAKEILEFEPQSC